MQSRRFIRLAVALLALAGAAASSLAAAATPTAGDHTQAHVGHAHAADHAHHMQMLQQQPGYKRSVHRYAPPEVSLVDQDGRSLALLEVLADPRPLMLNFIFTSCTTICPVLSASLAQAREALGPDAQRVRMVSITIDPEHDTPERLRRYARRFGAAEGWDFYTGDLQDIIRVQKAFDAFRGDKMSHIPLTFLRAAPDEPWIRMEGFANAGELIEEYRGGLPADLAQTID